MHFSFNSICIFV